MAGGEISGCFQGRDGAVDGGDVLNSEDHGEDVGGGQLVGGVLGEEDVHLEGGGEGYGAVIVGGLLGGDGEGEG